MSDPVPNPLVPADLDSINAALSQLNLALEMTRREAACGQNCQAHADVIDALRRKLEARKQAYFGSGVPQ